MLTINNWLQRKQKGIGLLELMLSLAVIAILLVMATRYYLTTSRSQRVNESVKEAQAIVAAVSDFYRNKGDLSNITVDDIAPSIPAPYISNGALNDPWGNSMNLQPAKQSVQVTFTTPDKETARLLATRLGLDSSSVTDSTLTITVNGAKGAITS